jgi:hypothetical protein
MPFINYLFVCGVFADISSDDEKKEEKDDSSDDEDDDDDKGKDSAEGSDNDATPQPSRLAEPVVMLTDQHEKPATKADAPVFNRPVFNKPQPPSSAVPSSLPSHPSSSSSSHPSSPPPAAPLTQRKKTSRWGQGSIFDVLDQSPPRSKDPGESMAEEVLDRLFAPDDLETVVDEYGPALPPSASAGKSGRLLMGNIFLKCVCGLDVDL